MQSATKVGKPWTRTRMSKKWMIEAEFLDVGGDAGAALFHSSIFDDLVVHVLTDIVMAYTSMSSIGKRWAR
jgi:hypothetical protein